MTQLAWRITVTRDNLTLGIAIIGAMLGAFNFTKDWWRNRIRLRVVPKLGATNKQGQGMVWDNSGGDFYTKQVFVGTPKLCIEVQNVGNRPVTVETVAFGSRSRLAKTRLLVRNPTLSTGEKLPVRLESHASFLAYTDLTPEAVWCQFGPFDCAIAETSTDQIFRGSSPILKESITSLRAV